MLKIFRAYPYLNSYILFYSKGLAIWHGLPDIRHIKVNYGRWSANKVGKNSKEKSTPPEGCVCQKLVKSMLGLQEFCSGNKSADGGRWTDGRTHKWRDGHPRRPHFVGRGIKTIKYMYWDIVSMLCPWVKHFTLTCFTWLRCKWVLGRKEMAMCMISSMRFKLKWNMTEQVQWPGRGGGGSRVGQCSI